MVQCLGLDYFDFCPNGEEPTRADLLRHSLRAQECPFIDLSSYAENLSSERRLSAGGMTYFHIIPCSQDLLPLRMKELEEITDQAGTVSFLGLSKPNATEQNKSLDLHETLESLGTFESFLNGFLGNLRLSSTASGFPRPG
jgi:hypothetical protein